MPDSIIFANMKKQLILSLLLISLFGVAQNQGLRKQSRSLMTRVVILRPSDRTGSWYSYKIYQGENLVGKLHNNGYFDEYLLSGDSIGYFNPAGEIIADSENTAEISLIAPKEVEIPLLPNPKPGGTYYFLVEIVPPPDTMPNGDYTHKNDFTCRISELSENTALKMIEEEHLHKASSEYVKPYFANNSNYLHFSFRGSSGVGFSDYDAYKTTTGTNVYISPGGGVAYGLRLGYTFNTNYDITCGLSYQTSDLSQVLENAYGNFQRLILGAAAEGLFPLGKRHFFGLGAGVNSYTHNLLKFDSRKMNNELLRLEYKDAVGYQLSAEWRMIVRRFLISAGLKYYNVDYHLDQVTLNGLPAVLIPGSGEDYSNLDGSGIDLEFGFGILF
jgi:hypothetical protein